MTHIDSPEIMTPEQVADYLQLAKDTVYRLIRQRKLAATRVGRAYRIPRQDLDQFIVSNSTREEVRERVFRRVLQIGERGPQVDGDALLDELETDDQGRASHGT